MPTLPPLLDPSTSTGHVPVTWSSLAPSRRRAVDPAVFHVTILSNFSRAYDKYRRVYDKAGIPESTFPDQFFVLREADLAVGLDKAHRLLRRLNRPGDRLLVLESHVADDLLQPNERTGLGRFLPGSSLRVDALWWFDEQGQRQSVIVEEAYAASLALNAPTLHAYADLAPRSMSVLPVARACQARCRFCFSESSASAEQRPHDLDLNRVRLWASWAAQRGAERFVITGGGEPGLLSFALMQRLIETARAFFPKVILITNGVHLARRPEDERAEHLLALAQAGLSVLSLSRHAADPSVNADIMGLDTGTERVLATWRRLLATQPSTAPLHALRLRTIAVLQHGGVADETSLQAYLDWAVEQGVHEVCFKELYVSSTLESQYHAAAENQWSRDHQVPLDLVSTFLAQHEFRIVQHLPWGAPIWRGTWQGRPLTVAAYTEPSLFWERQHGVARSWNLMADGTCLASLETPDSALTLPASGSVEP